MLSAKTPYPVSAGSRPQPGENRRALGAEHPAPSQLFGMRRDGLMEGLGKRELALLSGLAGRGVLCLFLRT